MWNDSHLVLFGGKSMFFEACDALAKIYKRSNKTHALGRFNIARLVFKTFDELVCCLTHEY